MRPLILFLETVSVFQIYPGRGAVAFKFCLAYDEHDSQLIIGEATFEGNAKCIGGTPWRVKGTHRWSVNGTIKETTREDINPT